MHEIHSGHTVRTRRPHGRHVGEQLDRWWPDVLLPGAVASEKRYACLPRLGWPVTPGHVGEGQERPPELGGAVLHTVRQLRFSGRQLGADRGRPRTQRLADLLAKRRVIPRNVPVTLLAWPSVAAS